MKRKKLLWLLLPIAVLCIVIFHKPAFRDPPELTVRSGDAKIKVAGSATSWRYKNNGHWTSYESSLKPVDPQGDYPQLESESEIMALEFKEKPDRVRVSRYWTLQAEKDEDATEVYWKPAGNELELIPGLYEIKVNWSTGDKKWGGNATYYFRAVGPGLSALEKPPELTISSGESEITALRGASVWRWMVGSTGKITHSDSADIETLKTLALELESADGTVTLDFPVKPDELTVTVDGAKRSLAGNELKLEAGKRFYEVYAVWDGDEKWDGSCYYYFHVATPAAGTG